MPAKDTKPREVSVLADGTEASSTCTTPGLLWDSQPRSVYVYVAETTPLVGMRLLEGHDLHVEVEDGGRVRVGGPLKEVAVAPTSIKVKRFAGE